MGYLKQKYNRGYFLKEDSEGRPTIAGVEGAELFKAGADTLRPIDEDILNRIKFDGMRVLEYGFGRGEAIKYALKKRAESVDAVDFSEDACEIAGEFLERNGLKATLTCDDALQFTERLADCGAVFDVVIMLDFVEHVPREELATLLQSLHKNLSDKAIIVINTPVYLVDNDVLKEGLVIEAADTSDEYEDTIGMHCNRYTKQSLIDFMQEQGYAAFSAHYFTNCKDIEEKGADKWEVASQANLPIFDTGYEEIYENATLSSEDAKPLFVPKWYEVQDGIIKGRKLFIDPHAAKWQQEIYEGEYDRFVFDFLETQDLKGKVVFDVGAHIGIHSLCLAEMVGDDGAVYAFEPSADNRERMQLNCSRNPELDSRIHVLEAGLSNVDGIQEFNTSSNVDGGLSSGSFITGSDLPYAAESYQEKLFFKEQIVTWTLDHIDTHLDIKKQPSIIKIDVEGAEHLVIEGGLDFLKKNKPILLIELHSFYNDLAIEHLLSGVGYYTRIIKDFDDNLLYNRRFIVAQHRDDLNGSVESVHSHFMDVQSTILEKSNFAVNKRDQQIATLEAEHEKYIQFTQGQYEQSVEAKYEYYHEEVRKRDEYYQEEIRKKDEYYQEEIRKRDEYYQEEIRKRDENAKVGS